MAGKATGGRAFPNDIFKQDGARGMTLRDYFAGQALAGLTANPGNGGLRVTRFSKMAYDVADAMILERDK